MEKRAPSAFVCNRKTVTKIRAVLPHMDMYEKLPKQDDKSSAERVTVTGSIPLQITSSTGPHLDRQQNASRRKIRVKTCEIDKKRQD